MLKLKMWDKVILTKYEAKYILSHNGQDDFFSISGILDQVQYINHYNATLLALLTLFDIPPVGEIYQINYPGTETQNYSVFFKFENVAVYRNLVPKSIKRLK